MKIRAASAAYENVRTPDGIYIVRLNGERVRWCVEADDDAGFVKVSSPLAVLVTLAGQPPNPPATKYGRVKINRFMPRSA